MRIRGAGPHATTIRMDAVTGDALTISAADVWVRDLAVTSTTGLRTGHGIVSTGSETNLHNLLISGHNNGVWLKSGAEFVSYVISQSNLGSGIVLDGSITAQNEVRVLLTQANGNALRGFDISGPGTGIHLIGVTAATNTGTGILLSGTLNDIWMVTPEISGNGGNGIDAASTTTDLHLVGPFVETSTTTNYNLAGKLVVLSGGFSGGAANGLVLSGTDAIVSGFLAAGSSTVGVVLGATSSRVALSNIIVSRGTSATVPPTGVRVDAGAAAFVLLGGNLSDTTTPLGGTPPAVSRITGVIGVTRALGVTLANGLSDNIAIVGGGASGDFLNITGPTAAFSLGGFLGGYDGQVLYVINNVAQAMTLVNESLTSTAANRIATLTGANVVLRAGTSFATFIYLSGTNRWLLASTN